jgi:acyl-CoA thioesterase-1
MSTVAIHFASGAAFFSGTASLLAGLMLVTFGRRKLLPATGRLLLFAGLILVAGSATPLTVWAWTVWGASFVVWATLKRVEAGALLAVIGCTLAAVVWELSYQASPRLSPGRRDRLVVIGDSLSAADFTEGGDPWPALLAREHKIRVVNLAFSGATAASAEKQVKSEDVAGALVLVEIGGNDLLGSTSAAEFELSLDRLLTRVSRADNAVIMLELPLPPLYNRFGEIQRRLARRHDVVLIPKRYFANVLAGSNATLDGLHLSRVGHQKMSTMISAVIFPSLVH